MTLTGDTVVGSRRVMQVVLLVVSVLASRTCRADAQKPAESAPLEVSKVEHLLKAAEHLESAGMHEEARKARDLAVKQLSPLLKRLEGLQAEVERLRRVTGDSQYVHVNVRIFELSRTRLRALHLDFAKLAGDKAAAPAVEQRLTTGKGPLPRALEENDPLVRALESLRKEGLVKLLAGTNLVALSGRPASILAGGEVPYRTGGKTEYKEYGTRVDATPYLIAGNKVRVDIRASFTELDRDLTISIDGQSLPALLTRFVDTVIECRLGQVMALSGLVQSREVRTADGKSSVIGADGKPAVEEVETIMLLRPTPASDAKAKRLGMRDFNHGKQRR